MIEITAFCFALLALTAYVARPLYGPSRDVRLEQARLIGGATLRPPEPPQGGTDVGQQKAKENALHDLEVDRASGLVDEATYAAERQALDQPGPPGQIRS